MHVANDSNNEANIPAICKEMYVKWFITTNVIPVFAKTCMHMHK